jgi:hypothetical protein
MTRGTLAAAVLLVATRSTSAAAADITLLGRRRDGREQLPDHRGERGPR